MVTIRFLAPAIVLLLVTATLPPIDAASMYKACALLTAAELETTIRAKVQQSNDSDVTIPEGPSKGEVMSTCTWALGATLVSLNVSRVRNAEQRAFGLALAQSSMEKLKKQGWTAESVMVEGVQCVILKPPAGISGAAPSTACFRESKGFGLSLSIGGAVSVPPKQVKALSDKVVARLP